MFLTSSLIAKGTFDQSTLYHLIEEGGEELGKETKSAQIKQARIEQDLRKAKI